MPYGNYVLFFPLWNTMLEIETTEPRLTKSPRKAEAEDLRQIPGIGATFVKDFARIGVTRVSQLTRRTAEVWFKRLCAANDAAQHATSKNYLYVLRMAVYFAEGGRDPKLLKWSAWTDAKRKERDRPAAVDGRALVELGSRRELRAWLRANHLHAAGAWIVLRKKSSPLPKFSLEDLCEELVCFGWVDSRPGKIDDMRSRLLCTPRSERSAWSSLNKQRYARMEKAGKVTLAGRLAKEAAVANGRWNALDEVEALKLPPDLVSALASEGDAATNFAAFPPSAKRGILEWISQAKRPATRAQRIAETARLAADNRRANQWPRR